MNNLTKEIKLGTHHLIDIRGHSRAVWMAHQILNYEYGTVFIDKKQLELNNIHHTLGLKCLETLQPDDILAICTQFECAVEWKQYNTSTPIAIYVTCDEFARNGRILTARAKEIISELVKSWWSIEVGKVALKIMKGEC